MPHPGKKINTCSTGIHKNINGGFAMSYSLELVKTWVKVGIVTGFLATIVYPLLITVPMPLTLTVALAAALGPLLSVASMGLYYYMAAHRRTVTLQIAVVFNIIAGTLVNTMLVVQLTVREFLALRLGEATDEQVREIIRWGYSGADKVQLGLDVSWDIYISAGTILFALNMLRHPRFGRIIGSAGIVIGALLLSFNLVSFPSPPGESGSIDLGPLAGIWYFIVAILMLRAFRKIDGDLGELTG
jgi:hypothetical protein